GLVTDWMRRLLRLVVCCAWLAAPLAAVSYDFTTVEVGSGGLVNPVAAVAVPGVPNKLFIVEVGQAGAPARILILDTVTGVRTATPFVTVPVRTSANESGLLGLAFHANYATNGFFYVNCTRASATAGSGLRTEILRYHAVGSPTSPTTADSETLIMSFDQPQVNHNGGWLGFGPDGKLYIGTGDGGGANDQHGTIGNGQDRTVLLAKILRIDVDGAQPYSIPADNPYSTHATFRKEIWCFGLRNPWRCSFDRTTGDLWFGDVGQGSREEVDVVPAGQKNLNFGWRPREGSIRNPSTLIPTTELPVTTATEPVTDYARAGGSTVIGGYVYRGSSMPWLQGTYLYGAKVATVTIINDDAAAAAVATTSTVTVTTGNQDAADGGGSGCGAGAIPGNMIMLMGLRRSSVRRQMRVRR
ncbi:MAG: PQQ-dependent sugar dehydrogenase, partial [Planctomycetota bacterium]